MESMKDRWLLASSTGPVRGNRSLPMTVGRQASTNSGRSTNLART